MLISLCIALIPLLLVGGFAYYQSTRIIERQVSQSNLNTVQQIADNVDGIFTSLDTFTMDLWRDDKLMNCLKLSRDEVRNSPVYTLNAQNAVNEQAVFDTDISSVYIMGYNGLVFDTASSDNTVSGALKQRLTELRGGGLLMPDTVICFDGSPLKVISFLRVLKDDQDLARVLAIIKVNMPEEVISGVYGSKLSKDSEMMIMDGSDTIISSSNKKELGTKLDARYLTGGQYQSGSGYFSVQIGSRQMLVTYVKLSQQGWKLVNIVPLSELSADAKIIQEITLSAVILSLMLCLLVGSFFSFRVLSPLREMRKSMKHLENERFNVNLKVKGNDEIALVSESFNKMSKRLGELINEVYAMQLKQREAELKALQAQINPHFLYNTLDMIYWMCRMENAVESSDLVQALSMLFRLSLNSGSDMTTVEKEVEHINYYIAIQEKRFDGMIRFEIQAADEALHCSVVKLILQPLVENAIYHGIEKKGTHGTIGIHICREEQDLVYRITDDGVGADESELNALLKKVGEGNKGFGIKNVDERIKLHFGDEYGIRFRTAVGRGTTVIVRQPFINGG
jgi:Predicted signal transduction protein with a C-terminal ATPase domain